MRLPIRAACIRALLRTGLVRFLYGRASCHPDPYLRGQPECKVGYATERVIVSFCSGGQMRQFKQDRNARHDWEEILTTRPVGRQLRRCEAPCTV